MKWSFLPKSTSWGALWILLGLGYYIAPAAPADPSMLILCNGHAYWCCCVRDLKFQWIVRVMMMEQLCKAAVALIHR